MGCLGRGKALPAVRSVTVVGEVMALAAGRLNPTLSLNDSQRQKRQQYHRTTIDKYKFNIL